MRIVAFEQNEYWHFLYSVAYRFETCLEFT